MRITSQKRWRSVALTAAGVLVLAGAVPALSQTSTTPSGWQNQQQRGQMQDPQPGQMMPPGETGQPGQADQTATERRDTTGAAPQAGQKLSDQEIRRHAQARVAIEQKVPDVRAKLETIKDPAKELSSEEQKTVREALKGTGVTFQQFAREHRQIAGNPQMESQLKQMEQEVRAQSGAQPPAGTSGAQQPGGGAPAPAPQPGAPPAR